ncbi:MAG: N-acetylmuramoyl-L-alanine amidase [Gammaproteobacteria bacterium]
MATIFKGCAPQNFRPGRHGFEPEAIVIHISVGSQTSCDHTFLNPHLDQPRSAHYSVSKAGEVHQYVEEADTAFHAGNVVAPTWSLIKSSQPGKYINPNFYTIGIEHEGFPDDEWPAAQYRASRVLIDEIRTRFNAITADRDHIVMHREIRADKSCPGFKVDMQRLINAGPQVGVQPTVSRTLVVTATTNLNLRQGAPSTAVPVVRTIPQGTQIAVVGFIRTGQPVSDATGAPNSIWYKDASGNYLWAGATDRPNP